MMNDGIKLWRYVVHVLVLYGATICLYLRADEQRVKFDELLEKTSYALLLKELIGLSDTIGLLHCRMQKDERRFVEDSILGKVVRVEHMLQQTVIHGLSHDEVDYLHYWIRLSQAERLPQLLYQQIHSLEHAFYTACEEYIT